jgi:hypothetical protein
MMRMNSYVYTWSLRGTVVGSYYLLIRLRGWEYNQGPTTRVVENPQARGGNQRPLEFA